MRVLVFNPGSSTLKAAVLETPRRDALAATIIDWGADATRISDHAPAITSVLGAVEAAGVPVASIGAVGYRIVHGGTRYVGPVLLDDTSPEAIEDLAELAPLHNRIGAETIRAARRALPGLPHVAAFDTAFHASLPPSGYRYPVPTEWFRDWGIRRFGFHGLSVAWSVTRASEMLGRPVPELRLVVAHLGSGCSASAVDGGVSVSTSMGFTPLDGLMMGTRAGSLDPGILLHLLRSGRIGLEELADTLDHRSGLLGVSGRSADVRELETAAGTGDERARLALAMFVGRTAAGIAAAAVSLHRLDALVFTGGIGEHAGRIRAGIVERLAVLGLRPIASEETGDDRVLAADPEVASPDVSTPAILRIEAREDLVVAQAVIDLLEGA